MRTLLATVATVALTLAPLPAHAAPDQSGATRTQTSSSYECPGDMPYCTRNAKDHVRAFKRGEYGRVRAGRRVRYSRPLRAKICDVTQYVWRRKRDTRFPGCQPVWQNFTLKDTCYFKRTRFSGTTTCRKLPWVFTDAGRRTVNNWAIDITLCASTAFPIIRTAESVRVAAYGTSVCSMSPMVTR